MFVIDKNRTLAVCSDDSHKIYIDGKEVFNNSLYNLSSKVFIPNILEVIAISVTNIHKFGAFKAALSDGSVVSDGSWKCSPKLFSDWQLVDFDDSLWSAPTTTGSFDACNDFPSSAKWLWTDKSYSSINTIYCRKTMSKISIYDIIILIYKRPNQDCAFHYAVSVSLVARPALLL